MSMVASAMGCWLIADACLQLPSRQVKQDRVADSCRKTGYVVFDVAESVCGV
jgi:hypothetical protein